MKVKNSWLIYSCIIFGVGVFCDRQLGKRQTVTSCTVNPEDVFKCSNGLCIESTAVCDGRADCSDGSDETNKLCSKQTCPKYAYRCKYGACVDKSKKCDGKNDCADGSDENLPECRSINSQNPNGPSKCLEDQYKCKSGQCIDETSTCDGTRDCKDGSDETIALCEKVRCQKYTFQCNYGACVSKESKCDGIRQCADGSDEEKCPGPNTTPGPTKPKPTTPVNEQTADTNSKNFCVLPTVEGVIYSYEGSNEILSHGSKIDHFRTVIENCEVGYHMTYPKSYRLCQGNGKWTSTVENLCLKMCPPLISDSLDIKCSLNGNNADCSKLSVYDTKAIPSCKPTHILPNGLEETPIELRCQSNGMWNNQLYRCIPYCGRLYTNSTVLITNGVKAKVGTAPWNTGIYQLNKESSKYDMICGGSLITSNLVVSAAHCFWQKDMLSKRLSINDGQFKIAVGKYDRDYTVIDNEFTQIMDVETIYIKENYYGANGFHAEDIAVIVLKNKVSISVGVAPACVDWTSKFSVPNGAQGKIVGWGQTEKGIQSPILLEATLPYIDHDSCRKMYTNGFQTFVTIDKFCAGSALGQGVHQGDSGAGLTYLHFESYYLTGVVSVKDPNTNNSIAVFTDVKRHIQWIRELYNKYTSYASDNISKPNSMVIK
ncbi:modular serine protease-like isoform X1 [Rhopalosiphum padi]|uniref:modular serine protease-like isoform X1 n=1 Tax=Rhopalosiphum padi TaxID=40932 RepID=UPI00298E4AA7|nr:modular serine protease-like isoform X1 [Rhopalosiphum padi]